MSDPDRAREPSMEEILASIRRIISDDKKEPQAENDEAPAREAGAGRAEEPNEPAHEPMHEPAGRFAAPEHRYRAMTAPEETGFAERERDPGPSFELRGASDDEAAPRRASAFEADEPPAPQEPTTTEEPAAAQQPAVTEEPSAVEEPPATEEPPTTEEQPAMQEASAMEEAVGGEDEPAMEEPTPIEGQSRLISTRTDAEVASAFAQLEDFVLSTHSRTLEDLVSEMLRPLLKEWLDANLPPLVERLVREEIERVSRGRR